jgi:hypothetical protein
MGLKNKEESFFSFGLQYSNVPLFQYSIIIRRTT